LNTSIWKGSVSIREIKLSEECYLIYTIYTTGEFLYKREKINNGILQRFVVPKGTSNGK
jgi:hypothetical protein